MKTFTLNNGVKMPCIGIGTAGLPKESIERVLGTAYDCGYRMIDTAWHYYNEEEIGNALQNLKIDRGELFITSKLHFDDLFVVENNKPVQVKTVKEAYEGSLRRLKIDYLDLYLVHWPWFNFEFMYKEICELYNQGKMRAIWVSSFEPHHLDVLLNNKVDNLVVPAVNQFEMSPYGQREYLTKYCNKHQIQCEAFSQFAVPAGLNTSSLLDDESLREIANDHYKSASQVVLRWLYQEGVVCIPRTKTDSRIKENIDIFDFVLSDDEMNIIQGLDKDEYTRPRKLKK